MTLIPTFRMAVLATVLTAIVFIGAVVWHAHPGQAIGGLAGHIFGPISVGLHRTWALTATFLSRRDLAGENLRLQEEVQHARVDAVHVSELERENAFLQAAMGLRDRLGSQPIRGAVFSYIRDGGVRQMVVNRGTHDGLVIGDVVVSAGGDLVGVIIEVFDRYAIARSFSDPSFEVTGRILNTEVSGLVRMDSSGGLILDLVRKGEPVSEGQTVITSGNDQFPPGLVIGTVTSVDNDSATLFKVVRLSAVAGDAFDGSVLIIHQ